MAVLIAAGTRPELIKLSTLIKGAKDDSKMDARFCFTGQHFDYQMTSAIMQELKLPTPDFDLGTKYRPSSPNLHRIFKNSINLFREERPSLVVVLGDTDSALAVSLAAVKSSVRVAHVEAGCRSFDRSTPEEINRLLIADLAEMHFAPTPTCKRNLLKEGITSHKIMVYGHPIVDVISAVEKDVNKSGILRRLQLRKKQFYLATVHRQENTDNPLILGRILRILLACSQRHPVVLPLHPRTRNRISKFGLGRLLLGLNVLPPLGYTELLALLKDSSAVLTDSAGIQQEASILGTYCVTLRTSTEWVETISAGANSIVGHSLRRTRQSLDRIESLNLIRPAANVFPECGATERILQRISKSN
jgi:UDP-N-acetylglucosamine 2-epimerase